MTWFITRLRVGFGRFRREFALDRLRRRLSVAPDGAVVRFPNGVVLRITDGGNAYIQYKDEFVRRNYAFVETRRSPLVIDGGANMGMFTIATRRDHADARIIAFEPDPQICAVFTENLARNGVRDVTVVNAALGGAVGDVAFSADGRAGGALLPGVGSQHVRVERLSTYLTDEVDFLKLNIEGAELEVLQEAADAGRLRNVAGMVVEYHGWPDGEQCLGIILSLLDAQGFRYMIHDSDEQSNPATKPPFHAPMRLPWFALVYAWRVSPPGLRP